MSLIIEALSQTYPNGVRTSSNATLVAVEATEVAPTAAAVVEPTDAKLFSELIACFPAGNKIRAIELPGRFQPDDGRNSFFSADVGPALEKDVITTGACLHFHQDDFAGIIKYRAQVAQGWTDHGGAVGLRLAF